MKLNAMQHVCCNLCRLDAGNHVDQWCKENVSLGYKVNVSLGKSAVVMWDDPAKH